MGGDPGRPMEESSARPMGIKCGFLLGGRKDLSDFGSVPCDREEVCQK